MVRIDTAADVLLLGRPRAHAAVFGAVRSSKTVASVVPAHAGVIP